MPKGEKLYVVSVPVSLCLEWNDDQFDDWALDEFDIPVPASVRAYLKEAITAAGEWLRHEVDHRLVADDATLTIRLNRKAFDA